MALGYHSGHWEVGLLVKAAAEELKAQRGIPFAGAVTDPCDGRTQGTAGMYDSLPFRNDAAMGGGGMMDIGCYCISLARFLFDAEPVRVHGIAEIDPAFGVDRLASGLLEFPTGTATFTCATQLAAYQRVNIFGTEGRIEIEIPFNAPPDRPTRIFYERAGTTNTLTFPACNQYSIQGDLFARAILDDTPVPTPLEDALANLRVIETLLAQAKSQDG